MWDRQEDPKQRWLRERVVDMRALVVAYAAQQNDLDQRFYLDALADVLQKTDAHIPRVFPSLLGYQKETLLSAWVENYELIHFEHERRLTYSTYLKESDPLTIAAIQRFYQCNRRLCQDPCKHAIFLYNKVLYHYNNTRPDVPILTEISPAYVPINGQSEQDRQVAAEQRRNNYATLKQALSRLPKDRIQWAQPEIRQCMADLQIPGVQAQYAQRSVDLALVSAFLPKIIDLLHAAKLTSRVFRKQMVAEGAKGAILIFCGMAVQLGLMAVSRYALGGTVIAFTNISLCLNLALLMAVAYFALSMGIAAYAFMQERRYGRMEKDIAQVQFTTTYRSPAGSDHPDRLFVMDEPKQLADFIREHQAVLAPAFPAP